MSPTCGAIGFHLSPWLGINVPGMGHGLFIDYASVKCSPHDFTS